MVRHIFGHDFFRVIIMSLCVTIIGLYVVSIREKIGNFIIFDKILLDSNYNSKTFVTYDDLFLSLEQDLSSEVAHYEDTLKEDEAHDDHNTIEKTELTKHDNMLQQEKQTQELIYQNPAPEKYAPSDDVPVKNQKTSAQANATSNNFSKNRFMVIEDSQYILPIADALERNNNSVFEGRNRLKQDIADLYEKRKNATLIVREYLQKTTNDLAQLKKIFETLNFRMQDRFSSLKFTKFGNNIVKKLGISHEELAWRYPELKKNLEKINQFQAFSSFLPINDPIYNGRKSSAFGYRRDPFTRKARMHSGLDYAARTGTPVIAPASGIIQFAGYKGGYGLSVDVYHGNGLFTRYGHLSRINVSKGQRVNRGQKLAAVGSTGRSTGPHLHYEIRVNGKAVNPMTYINKKNYINELIKKHM